MPRVLTEWMIGLDRWLQAVDRWVLGLPRSAVESALNYGALVMAGLAAMVIAYLVQTWGRRHRLWQRTEAARVQIRLQEPLLVQLWRLLRLMGGVRVMERLMSGFSLFDRDRLEELLADARYPMGLRTVLDIRAVGVSVGVVLLLTLLYLAESALVLAALPILVLVGMLVPVVMLRLAARNVRQVMVRELWLLMSGLEVYLQAGYPLYDALKESASACPTIGEAVGKALLQWGSAGRLEALDELGRTLRLPEAFLVIGAIRQATEQDAAGLVPFMMRESMRLDKVMEAAQTKSRQLKPVLQNLALMVPMFNVFALWTAPIAYSVFSQLQEAGGFR